MNHHWQTLLFFTIAALAIPSSNNGVADASPIKRDVNNNLVSEISVLNEIMRRQLSDQNSQQSGNLVSSGTLNSLESSLQMGANELSQSLQQDAQPNLQHAENVLNEELQQQEAELLNKRQAEVLDVLGNDYSSQVSNLEQTVDTSALGGLANVSKRSKNSKKKQPMMEKPLSNTTSGLTSNTSKNQVQQQVGKTGTTQTKNPVNSLGQTTGQLGKKGTSSSSTSDQMTNSQMMTNGEQSLGNTASSLTQQQGQSGSTLGNTASSLTQEGGQVGNVLGNNGQQSKGVLSTLDQGLQTGLSALQQGESTVNQYANTV